MTCPNCNFEETVDAGFCSKCGQKFGPAKLTIRQFIADLIDHVFNLDTNFFRTVKKIFIPGQLTLDYFDGHRKMYYHPLRLFFFLLVIHLGVLGGLIPYETIFESMNSSREQILASHENKLILDKLSKLRNDHNSMIALDSARKWLVSDHKKIFNKTDSIDEGDTITSGPLVIRTTGTGKENGSPGGKNKNKGFSLIDISAVEKEDLYILPVDSIMHKYHYTGFLQKLALGQSQKFSKDPKGMIQFILGNLSWMMVVLIPILAIFLKLLFIRRKRYYIEHLFYLYHWHSFAFLLGTILVVFFRDHLTRLIPFFFTLVILFGFVAWKRYYIQGWFKSIIKFSMMCISYLFLFTILIFLTALISFGFY